MSIHHIEGDNCGQLPLFAANVLHVSCTIIHYIYIDFFFFTVSITLYINHFNLSSQLSKAEESGDAAFTIGEMAPDTTPFYHVVGQEAQWSE